MLIQTRTTDWTALSDRLLYLGQVKKMKDSGRHRVRNRKHVDRAGVMEGRPRGTKEPPVIG